MNVKSRQLTYSQYAGEWDSKVRLIIVLVIISLKIVIMIMVIIKIIFLVIINDHVQDWAWDKTNFLAADISAAEFSIQYNNGLVIILSSLLFSSIS